MKEQVKTEIAGVLGNGKMGLCPLDVLGKRSNPKCSSQNLECFLLSTGVFPESGNTFQTVYPAGIWV